MRRSILAILVVFLAGCASTPKYMCTAGDEVYYAEHYSAIVMTEEVVLIGDCKEV